MRILHVFRAPVGGLYRHVVDLAREQIARGHSVGFVVDALTGGERAAANLAALEPTLELGVVRTPMHRMPQPADLAVIARIESHVRRLKVDVVHGHGAKGGLYARLPGFLQASRRPIRCYTPHGGSFLYPGSAFAQSVYMKMEGILAARTDLLLFESAYVAGQFARRVGTTHALTRIICNGVSRAECVPVEPAPDAADFVYVGELRSAKGIDTLIDATALASHCRKRPVRLVLVGAGPDREQLMDRCRVLGIADHVTFPGPMPARSAFRLGRALVVPSRRESFPYIVLEGAAARIPMIATDVGGIGEIFGPFRDRLVAADDACGLASSMGAMMDADFALAQRQAQDLAAFVEANFSVTQMAEYVLAGYREAFERREAPAKVHTPLPAGTFANS